MLFGENFGALVKTKLDAAAALKKTLAPNKWKLGFPQSHPKKSCGGDNPSNSSQGRGWEFKSNKALERAPSPGND